MLPERARTERTGQDSVTKPSAGQVRTARSGNLQVFMLIALAGPRSFPVRAFPDPELHALRSSRARGFAPALECDLRGGRVWGVCLPLEPMEREDRTRSRYVCESRSALYVSSSKAMTVRSWICSSPSPTRSAIAALKSVTGEARHISAVHGQCAMYRPSKYSEGATSVVRGPQ